MQYLKSSKARLNFVLLNISGKSPWQSAPTGSAWIKITNADPNNGTNIPKYAMHSNNSGNTFCFFDDLLFSTRKETCIVLVNGVDKIKYMYKFKKTYIDSTVFRVVNSGRRLRTE